MMVKFLRNGKVFDKQVTMKTIDALVPAFQWDKTPSYFIFAGLTFINLTRTFLQEYASEINREYPQWERDAPRKLVELAATGMPDAQDQQVVILSQILTSEVNHGYQHMLDAQVVKVNGEKILNLSHLKDVILSTVDSHKLRQQTMEDNEADVVPHDDGAIVVEFADARILVLDIDMALQSHEALLEQHRVPSDRSADLQ